MKKINDYNKCKMLCFTLLLLLISACSNKTTNTSESATKPNILFIAVDDLRPEIGFYGAKQIHSPSIERLASEGLTFNRAYCNIPVCGASRASILSGVNQKTKPNKT